MARRQTLGRLSLSQSNMAPPVKDQPQGILKPSRDSIAEDPRRLSTLGRPSLSTSRPSMGVPGSRTSAGVKPADSRGSISSRRMSLAVGPKVADPRPIGSKAFTLQCTKTVMSYLSLNNYDGFHGPSMMKVLASPSKQDVKSILSFLFRRIDPNFEFGVNFEDDVKTYLKLFGYPSTISKSALTAVGSPHSWPTLLAAITWVVEFLNYDEVAHQAPGATASLESLMEGDDGEMVFFQYTSSAYQSFLEGNDNYNALDEELSLSFQKKNKQVEKDINTLQQSQTALTQEAARLKCTEQEIKELTDKREVLKIDIEKLKKFSVQLREHKATQDQKTNDKKMEYEEKVKELQTMAGEKKELESTIASQKFSPLEVQALNHQRLMLEGAISNLDEQKLAVQKEVWEKELANCKLVFEIEKKVKMFNEAALSLELLPRTARYAAGQDYKITFNINSRDDSIMVPDLTKEIKPCLANIKRQLASDIIAEQMRLRETGAKVLAVADHKSDQEKRHIALLGRYEKLEAINRKERQVMDDEIQQQLGAVEAVELEVAHLQQKQSRILEASEGEIHALDNELLQARQNHLALRDKLVGEMQEMSDRVLAHKMMVTRVLKDVLEGIQSTRENIAPLSAPRTPAPSSRTPGKTPGRN